jgi:hypothetical protein
VTVAYLAAKVTPSLGGRVPIQYGFPPQSAPPDFPVTAYPTLEELFGSLDYCNCDDCGSILSPAAYLVDLLNYIDQPAPTAGGSNPLDVLLARRPDLQYLPLTCANTNTALPYIDIVNEVLEYFVANRLQISGYQGHDTGDSVTSAELVASPQYVNDAAYGLLQNAFFPPPLPYNRPLELLRFHLASLGVSLPAAMAALRPNDNLPTPRRRPATAGPTSCSSSSPSPATSTGCSPIRRCSCRTCTGCRTRPGRSAPCRPPACRISPAASASATTT